MDHLQQLLKDRTSFWSIHRKQWKLEGYLGEVGEGLGVAWAAGYLDLFRMIKGFAQKTRIESWWIQENLYGNVKGTTANPS